MDLNQALVLPISGNGNHRHMQSLVGMRSAALIPPEVGKAKLIFAILDQVADENYIAKFYMLYVNVYDS